MIAATVQDRIAGNEPAREGTAIITVFAPVPVHLNVDKIISGKNGRVVSDGPFAESKEAIGGYFLLAVDSLEEAVAIAQTSLARPFSMIRGGSSADCTPCSSQLGRQVSRPEGDADSAASKGDILPRTCPFAAARTSHPPGRRQKRGVGRKMLRSGSDGSPRKCASI